MPNYQIEDDKERYDQRLDAVRSAFRTLRVGRSVQICRDVQGVRHIKGDCPCKPIFMERLSDDTEEKFIKRYRDLIGN